MISPAPSFRLPSGRFAAARSRRGLTIIELLAATVISLIVMGATVQLFGTVGAQITNGRSNIELSDRLRSAIERLRKDLRGVTVDMRTWNRPEDASGYFEIVKGPLSSWDKYISPTTSAQTAPATNASAFTGTLVGYTKDGLFFTTRSSGAPFVGRAMNASGQTPVAIESQVAEVAWYLQPTSLTPVSTGFTATTPPTFTLYRRQLLVAPGLAGNQQLGIGGSIASGVPGYIPATNLGSPTGYYDNYSTGTQSVPNGCIPLYDISAHPDVTTLPSSGDWHSMNMVLNSLADLSYRENRFGHFFAPQVSSASAYGTQSTFGSGQPFPVGANQSSLLAGFPSTPPTDPNLRYGEDVVLANVLSFDVKVWDPWCQVLQDANGNPMVPSDPGYSSGKAIGSGVYGAYVDLNWNNGTAVTNPSGYPAPFFAMGYYGSGTASTQKSYLVPGTGAVSITPSTTFPVANSAVYDTWSAGYEAWLYNFTSTTGAPQQSNQSFDGLDGTGQNGVDSANERLTSPPYPVPLRGIQIKIRTYEFSSKQVREATITESFVPD